MRQATTRLRLEQELAGVLQGHGDSTWFSAPSQPRPETARTGIPEIDALTGGIPLGQITEVTGVTSSGRTSLLLSILAEVSAKGEVAALIDPGNAFDPASAAVFGVHLDRLLWIRARSREVDPVLRITDLLLEGGGFGLIGVDLSSLRTRDVRRVPLSAWFRLQRAAEHTPTILLFLNREPIMKSAAALALQMDAARTDWSGRVLDAVRPGARVVRSRQDPSSSGETRLFRLCPPALIEAGRTHSSTEA